MPERHFHPAPKASIERAIQQVNEIVDTLKETLEDMEEVLETLETFERQGNADEREIESLRRALKHLQRPRDGGGHHRGHG
jgi:ABC-type transporter Mla subunit MlaD